MSTWDATNINHEELGDNGWSHENLEQVGTLCRVDKSARKRLTKEAKRRLKMRVTKDGYRKVAKRIAVVTASLKQ